MKRFVVDIETMIDNKDDTYKMDLGATDKILIGLYDGKDYFQFYDFKNMLKFLFGNFKECIVYAHNGGKYDFLYLLDTCIQKKCYLTNIININGSVIFNLRYKDRVIIFRDSLKLLPSSLDNLGNAYLSDKKKIHMDYTKSYKLEDIEIYLKRDCETLFEILKIFENEINSTLKNDIKRNIEINIDDYISMASLAFHILIDLYLGKITHNYLNREEENFIRKAYYGGRVEIYRLKGNNLFYYDVNSLYPAVMFNNFYPIGKHFQVMGHDKISRIIKKGKLGIVKAEIEYPKKKICVLPYRTKHNGTIYPYGKFIGSYTSVELVEAIKEGAKVKYISGIFWSNKEKIFEEFISDFYKIKQNSTGAKKAVAKNFLNSCYGKYGQKRTKQIILSELEVIKKKKLIVKYEMLGEDNSLRFYCRNEESYRNRNTNPVYASFVTSYARLYLFNFMRKLGFDNIYYCDTDSIICLNEMDSKYVDNDKLGYFKKEYENVLEGYFVSPKLYGLRIKEKYSDKKLNKIKDSFYYKIDGEFIIYDVIKAKGVYKEFLLNYNGRNKPIKLEDFKSICQNRDFKFKNKNMVSFKQKFKRLDFKEKNTFINLDITPKELSCEYNKRKIIGVDTSPIEIDIKDEL